MSDGTFRPELFGTPATRAWRVVRNVPRSQVRAGSRSGHTGRRHLEATANVSLEALSGRGTLLRRRGLLLCGYEPWHKETIDPEETAPPPPRCPACEIKARRYGIKWPET